MTLLYYEAALSHLCKEIFATCTLVYSFKVYQNIFYCRRGQGSTIEGLDIAVGSMKAQEQSEFIFTPELAFGFTGCPPRIPPNAYVLFHIDLIEWVDSSAAESFHKLPMTVRKSLPFSQVLEAAKSEKCKAHHHFQKQSYNIVNIDCSF